SLAPRALRVRGALRSFAALRSRFTLRGILSMALQPFFNSNNKLEETYPRPGVSPNAAVAAGQAPVSAHPVAKAAPVTKEGESKLTVGPNIKLKGVEITDCDTLVVEGSVAATMDSRVIQISERGSFKGSAEIDVAEIRG